MARVITRRKCWVATFGLFFAVTVGALSSTSPEVAWIRRLIERISGFVFVGPQQAEGAERVSLP